MNCPNCGHNIPGIPEPAMQPLHPDKPAPPIEVGAIWAKKASGKTSLNRPRCRVLGVKDGRVRRVMYSMMHPVLGACSQVTERVFRCDWEPN